MLLLQHCILQRHPVNLLFSSLLWSVLVYYILYILIPSHILCLFLGPGSVLFQVLCKPSDSGDSDWSLLAGGRSDAQGVYQQSQPLRSLQELSGTLTFLQFINPILTRWMWFWSSSQEKAKSFFFGNFDSRIYWGTCRHISSIIHKRMDWNLSCVICGSEISTSVNSCGVAPQSRRASFCHTALYSLHAVCILEFYLHSLIEKLIWETKNLEGMLN